MNENGRPGRLVSQVFRVDGAHIARQYPATLEGGRQMLDDIRAFSRTGVVPPQRGIRTGRVAAMVDPEARLAPGQIAPLVARRTMEIQPRRIRDLGAVKRIH